MDPYRSPTDSGNMGLRASDAEREQTATLLREHYTDGRLTLEELQDRLDRAYTATTVGDLETLTSDLPVHRSAGTGPSTPIHPSPASSEWKRRRDRVLAYVVLMLFLIGIWAASGMQGSFWPIWPILVGGFIVARDVLGLSHSGFRHDRRRAERHQRRIARHQRRMDRRFGPRNDEE